jgi:MYXO-CTERM domain-containing protein
LGASAGVLLNAVNALAAMDATLSSSHARPGDSVLLLTEDHKGTWTYDLLSSENHQGIYLSPTTGDWGDACGAAGSQMVGRLQWRGNAGGLAFIVPSLPPANYWLFMETSGQCWRVGGVTQTNGPLVLSIGNTAADNQDVATRWTVDSLPAPKQGVAHPSSAPSSSSSTPTPWFSIIGAGALALLAYAAWRWRRRLLKSG